MNDRDDDLCLICGHPCTKHYGGETWCAVRGCDCRHFRPECPPEPCPPVRIEIESESPCTTS